MNTLYDYFDDDEAIAARIDDFKDPENFIVDDVTQCWEWHTTLNTGYPSFFQMGKTKLHAHRAAYLFFIGDIPENKSITRTCGNKSCVNPAHLALSGSRRPSKLKEADVIEMRRLFATGRYRPSDLAKKFDVGNSVAWRVCHNKTWTHLLKGAK